MSREEILQRGREAVREQAWVSVFSLLSAADQKSPLAPPDVEMLAMAAQLTGRESESSDLLARAHQGFLNDGDVHRAARCAMWLGFRLLYSGERAQGGGWMARAQRLVDGQPDCVEHGYLLLPGAQRSVREGDAAEGYDAFVRATAIGERFGDRDLATMALHGQGRALIRMGELARGVGLLDEAMVAVTSGEVSAIIAGTVYCSVIESCQETLDLGRAQEWTAALHSWCASQPEMLPFRGPCLLHRAEVMQLRGDWPDALDETRLACERLSQPVPKPSLGAAFYRLAELHRLRGEFGAAEEAYRKANQLGHTPQPGFAQLRLAQGQLEAAFAAIRGAANDVRETVSRARVLDALVEIALAAGDVPSARVATDELAAIAEKHGAPLLRAMSDSATGAVLLAERDCQGALTLLRQAWSIWCELEAPHQAARVRVLIALACREQGDCDTGDLEIAAAREAFEHLGAAPDIAWLQALWHDDHSKSTSPLSAREAEVLKLVASGVTNREIAGSLGISEKTVARHISNIFVKLDLSSRAAATAYAFRCGLV